MNDAQGAKQQIAQRIKDSANILVTVNTNPSVDELSAALGLTIMLNNIKKHATAVVSGAIPPAISFLEPDKTFESTVDSLRDFIIALDKEKADHLRYKVDGDVVKIFITPYRTTITQDDLDFSQGDYNVELVLALGVRDESHLDKALEAHGRILHDATVATLSCGSDGSQLGSIDWYEPSASSISEMLVSLSEALKSDKPLLDEQVSTALLTGIVAATDRFSNNKTSSKVMTMAAQLMAAGANQQLIAARLEEGNEISGDDDSQPPVSSGDGASGEGENKDGTTDLEENASMKLDRKKGKKSKKSEPSAEEVPKPDDGTLAISHELKGDVDEVAKQVDEQNTEAAAARAEDALADQLESVAPAAAATQTPSVADLQKDLAAANAVVEEAAEQAAAPTPPPVAPSAPASLADIPMPSYEPTIGGALNATMQEAEEERRHEQERGLNHTILNHEQPPTGSGPSFLAANEPASAPAGLDFSSLPPLPTASAATITPPSHAQTLAELDEATRGKEHDDARSAVAAAFDTMPPTAPVQPLGSGAAPVFNASDDTGAASASTSPAINSLQDDSKDLPPLPDFTVLPPPPPAPNGIDHASVFPPQPPEQLGQILPDAPAPQPPQPTDPGQFRIPGQG